MVAENIKNKTDYDTYIVYDDSKSVEFLDVNNNVIGYEKGMKKVSKKSSKKSSKKLSKKSSKKLSKKLSKKSSKKLSKKSSKKIN